MEKFNTIRKRKEEENIGKGGYGRKYVEEIEHMQGKISNKVCTFVLCIKYFLLYLRALLKHWEMNLFL